MPVPPSGNARPSRCPVAAVSAPLRTSSASRRQQHDYGRAVIEAGHPANFPGRCPFRHPWRDRIAVARDFQPLHTVSTDTSSAPPHRDHRPEVVSKWQTRPRCARTGVDRRHCAVPTLKRRPARAPFRAKCQSTACARGDSPSATGTRGEQPSWKISRLPHRPAIRGGERAALGLEDPSLRFPALADAAVGGHQRARGSGSAVRAPGFSARVRTR